MHDELRRNTPLARRVERQRVRVADEALSLVRQEANREVVAPAQVQELVLADRLVAVGLRGGGDKLRELFDVLAFQPGDDFDVVHVR